MDLEASLRGMIAEHPGTKTVIIQSSHTEQFSQLETLVDQLSSAFPEFQFSVSFSSSGRCSAVVDALHFQRPVLLFHVDPECLCGLEQRARLEAAKLQLFYVTRSGQLIEDAEKYVTE